MFRESREVADCHSGVSIEDLIGNASDRLYLGFLVFTNPKNEMERIASLMIFYMLQVQCSMAKRSEATELRLRVSREGDT